MFDDRDPWGGPFVDPFDSGEHYDHDLPLIDYLFPASIENEDPEDAAEALASILRELAHAKGKDPDEVIISETEDGHVKLSWGQGPLDWGMYLSSQCSMWYAEPQLNRPRDCDPNRPETDLFSCDHWYLETEYGYDLVFMPTT